MFTFCEADFTTRDMKSFRKYVFFAETRHVLISTQLTFVKGKEKKSDDDDETRTMKSGYEKYANHFGIRGLYEL